MKTSYFSSSKCKKAENVVSIAGYPPNWFTSGREYKKLAPKLWFFRKYKEDGDKAAYEKAYQEEVLDLLDPQQVYDELGSDAIITCWEKGVSGLRPEQQPEFCHRFLVAAFLEKHLGIEVLEL